MRRKHRTPRNAPRNSAAAEPMVVLVRAVASREEVVHACERARKLGVKPGPAGGRRGKRCMSLADARALLGNRPVAVVRHDAEADRAALERLAAWATRFAPVVMADPDEESTPPMPGLLMDITGCERLYHGEANLLKQLLNAMHRLGFQARVAAGPTFGSAWALARFGDDALASIGEDDLPEALLGLPLRGLRVGREVEDAFAEVGVTTIGQVLDLPRSSLPARFGAELTTRIDQVLGHAAETITPLRPGGPMMAMREFAGPVKQLEAIEAASRELLSELCRKLLGRESGLRQLEVVLERSDCEPLAIHLSVSRFSRDVKHLWSLLWPKLEKANLGFGVEAIRLTASRFGALPHRQRVCFPADAAVRDSEVERELAAAVDVLANRLGVRAVCRAEAVESHVPERVARFAPMSGAKPRRTEHEAALVKHDRPSVLLPAPRPIRVMAVTPDGPVVQMTWEGQSLRVLKCIGPERLASEWWRQGGEGGAADAPARDYFKVQDEQGRWWWLFREVDGPRWFTHGGWV